MIHTETVYVGTSWIRSITVSYHSPYYWYFRKKSHSYNLALYFSVCLLETVWYICGKIMYEIMHEMQNLYNLGYRKLGVYEGAVNMVITWTVQLRSFLGCIYASWAMHRPMWGDTALCGCTASSPVGSNDGGWPSPPKAVIPYVMSTEELCYISPVVIFLS